MFDSLCLVQFHWWDDSNCNFKKNKQAKAQFIADYFSIESCRKQIIASRAASQVTLSNWEMSVAERCSASTSSDQLRSQKSAMEGAPNKRSSPKIGTVFHQNSSEDQKKEGLHLELFFFLRPNSLKDCKNQSQKSFSIICISVGRQIGGGESYSPFGPLAMLLARISTPFVALLCSGTM